MDKYDLDKAWAEEVLPAFEKTARVKLQPDKILTPDDVILQLKLKHDHDAIASQRHSGLKKALWRALECVKTLGTVAAMDQSQVLGGSRLATFGKAV
jgi:hypothetical protein